MNVQMIWFVLLKKTPLKRVICTNASQSLWRWIKMWTRNSQLSKSGVQSHTTDGGKVQKPDGAKGEVEGRSEEGPWQRTCLLLMTVDNLYGPEDVWSRGVFIIDTDFSWLVSKTDHRKNQPYFLKTGPIMKYTLKKNEG